MLAIAALSEIKAPTAFSPYHCDWLHDDVGAERFTGAKRVSDCRVRGMRDREGKSMSALASTGENWISSPTGFGADQPARRSFGIHTIYREDRKLPVIQRDLSQKPFCALTAFQKQDAGESKARILVIPPLSGHFAFLFRDLVLEMLSDHDVIVVDWINARHVPVDAGPFRLDDNITYAVEMIRELGTGTHVLGLCQGAIPALAATAVLAKAEDAATPRSLALIAAPVDPTANPTKVVRLIRERSLDWFEQSVFETVGNDYPGAGRRVYPARFQFSALMTYLMRHLSEGRELLGKVLTDDGADPIQFPFLNAYSSVMDLPAEWFLDNVRHVFHERAIPRNRLRWRGRPVDFSAITETALMTIEGELDDVAAPGQTSAAHALCTHIPDKRRDRYVLPGAGHFSTFHGHLWRRHVAPRLRDFIARAEM